MEYQDGGRCPGCGHVMGCVGPGGCTCALTSNYSPPDLICDYSQETRMKPVKTKTDFVKRYQTGEFGNRSPTWDNLHDVGRYRSSDFFHIRNRVASDITWYDVPGSELQERWHEACQIRNPSSLYISQMAPTPKTVLQGELTRLKSFGTGQTLQLVCSYEKKTMREALNTKSETYHGVVADWVLKKYLPNRDYEWLVHLLDTYEDHVIEFSTYSIPFGVLPGFRTCFWEVRQY